MKPTRILMAILAMSLSGCITTRTVQLAQGGGHWEQNDKGKLVEKPGKPYPAAYALVPLTATADVVILPFWVLATMVGILPPEM
jgi:uncharacterized protein YceK